MLRTKSEGGSDVSEIAKQLSAKFNEFKSTNEQRLDGIVQEKAALSGQVEKMSEELLQLSEIKTQMEVLEKKANRPGPQGQATPEQAEHKEAFGKFLRKGVDDGLGKLQAKALQISEEPDGGFAVPVELDQNIIQLLRNSTPMRQVCNVIQLGTPEYRKLVSIGGAGSGWVGETDERPQTNTPKLAQITPHWGEIYANPQATQQMLDDVFFNAESWLADELATEFSEKENLAFTSGNGEKKPKGLLAYATAATADGTRPFGTFQHIETAGAGAIGGDDIVTFAFKLKTGYQQNAGWMLNRNALANLMILKDGEGNYLWRPGLTEGLPATLAGFGFTVNDDMPNIAAGAKPIAFGDFRRGYTITDRIGTRVLRDPYTNKPFVGFYTTKRVGGMATDTQAIKFLQVKA